MVLPRNGPSEKWSFREMVLPRNASDCIKSIHGYLHGHITSYIVNVFSIYLYFLKRYGSRECCWFVLSTRRESVRLCPGTLTILGCDAAVALIQCFNS
jgi:hypothetical protein